MTQHLVRVGRRYKLTITLKMADQERSDFGVVFITSLCALEFKETLISFAISNHTAFIIDVHSLRSCMRVTCEYEIHILPDKKVSAAKDHGKNYMKDRRPLDRHLLHNGLLSRTAITNDDFVHLL